jgi:hypothetical protein
LVLQIPQQSASTSALLGSEREPEVHETLLALREKLAQLEVDLMRDQAPSDGRIPAKR